MSASDWIGLAGLMAAHAGALIAALWQFNARLVALETKMEFLAQLHTAGAREVLLSRPL